jgi:hypothetical protein
MDDMFDEIEENEEKVLDAEIVPFSTDEKHRIGTAITTAMSDNPSETGAKLMQMATDREESMFMDTVLNRVKEVVSHLNNLYIAKEKLEREIALFIKRKEAIEKGQFKIDRDGRLQYNDILLNY